MSKQEHTNQEEPKISDLTYQDKDINIKAVAYSVLGTLVVVAFSFWAMKVLYNAYDKNMYEARGTLVDVDITRDADLIVGPKLQVDEPADIAVYKAEQNALEKGQRWLNKTEQTVAIPVDVAMDLILKEGLPARKSGK